VCRHFDVADRHDLDMAADFAQTAFMWTLPHGSWRRIQFYALLVQSN